LLERKLTLLRKVLDVTRNELLLVELDGLAPLIERKDALITELAGIDRSLESLGGAARQGQSTPEYSAELTRLVEAILDNERTMETRMGAERERLRRQLQDLERQARIRGYLERQRPRSGKVDLTR
jgi:hypothetical protein